MLIELYRCIGNDTEERTIKNKIVRTYKTFLLCYWVEIPFVKMVFALKVNFNFLFFCILLTITLKTNDYASVQCLYYLNGIFLYIGVKIFN